MGTATLSPAHDPTKSNQQQAAEQAAAMPVIHFTKGSAEHSEGSGFDVSVSNWSAGSQDLGPYDIPAFGYLRSLIMYVTATGGSGTATVATTADAPWSVISRLTFEDVNGAPIQGVVTGYDLYLENKWGGYMFNPDPAVSPAFSAVATGANASGNFTFVLRVPLEVNAREALGALPNQSTAQQFKLRITLAASSAVYSTPPTNLPTVRFRGSIEAWAQPSAVDAAGIPQTQQPPASGTTSYWTKQSPVTAAGQQTIKVARVGNLIRNLIFVFRDNTGARNASNIPDPIIVSLDGRYQENIIAAIQRHRMAERFGFPAANIDTGVIVFDNTHDLNGHPAGGELRDLWLPTTQGSRLELIGSNFAAGTVDVLVNDVVPAVGATL